MFKAHFWIRRFAAMAKTMPFRGVLYNPDKIQDLKDVVTPPYDVISERQRRAYFERHPQNVIRLILSKERPDDTEKNNRYTRAGEFFRSWLDAGILKQDVEPAFYVTEMDFSNEDEVRTRLGFVVLVRLEDFGKGGILPHEKTFSATKADRLKLMEACKANFSPIFSLFADPDEEVMGLLRTCTESVEPDIDFREVIGYRHRLWRVTDGQIHRQVSEKMAARCLFIADGHHRYETALNYKNQIMSRIMSQNGTFDSEAPCNYVMMYLTSMQDRGMIIRSVHRLLSKVPQDAMDGFVKKAKDFFDVEVLNAQAGNYDDARTTLFSKIRAGADQGVMGAVVRNHDPLYFLRAKEGIMDRLFEGDISAPLRKLDVKIATKLVIQKVLGFDKAALDDEKRISYTSRAPKAFKAVKEGKCDVALILNPTRLSDVEEISRAGLIMPKKSTYFFPKVVSGLVINKLD